MKCAFALGGLLALATPSFAGELIPELVPADARWLAHLDLEALQASVLYQTLSARSDDFRDGLAEMQAELGADPLGMIRSISLYSTSAEPETGVAVMVVSEEATALLEKLQQHEGYAASQVGGRLMHSWSDPDGEEGERVYAHVHTFEGVSNRLVFLSDDQEQVTGALEVLDGKRPALTDVQEKHLRAQPRAGSFFYLETSEALPGMEALEDISAFASLARGLRFDLGEAGGVLNADLAVTAENAGQAQKLHAVLTGLTALAGLVDLDEGGEELLELAGALRFTTNGNELGAQFQFDSRRLVDMLEELE